MYRINILYMTMIPFRTPGAKDHLPSERGLNDLAAELFKSRLKRFNGGCIVDIIDSRYIVDACSGCIVD